MKNPYMLVVPDSAKRELKLLRLATGEVLTTYSFTYGDPRVYHEMKLFFVRDHYIIAVIDDIVKVISIFFEEND